MSASEACRAVMAITTSDSATSSGGSGSSTSAVSAAATAAAEVSQVDLRSDYLVSLATTVLPAPAVEGVAPRKDPRSSRGAGRTGRIIRLRMRQTVVGRQCRASNETEEPHRARSTELPNGEKGTRWPVDTIASRNAIIYAGYHPSLGIMIIKNRPPHRHRTQ